jgi:hypothetical protein
MLCKFSFDNSENVGVIVVVVVWYISYRFSRFVFFIHVCQTKCFSSFFFIYEVNFVSLDSFNSCLINNILGFFLKFNVLNIYIQNELDISIFLNYKVRK